LCCTWRCRQHPGKHGPPLHMHMSPGTTSNSRFVSYCRPRTSNMSEYHPPSTPFVAAHGLYLYGCCL
jgi:hypothetical protein